jgi:Fe2+ transport system protein FeoA
MKEKILSLRQRPVSSSVCEPDSFGRILNYDQSGRSFPPPIRVAPREPGRVSVLSDLNVGECGVVISLDLPDSVQNHLMHMGFVPEARVTALRRAPAGDPTVYTVDGLEIALRRETASAILVRAAEGPVSNAAQQDTEQQGEGARVLAGAAQ